MKDDVPGEKAVSADHDIHTPFRHASDGVGDFARFAKATKEVNPDGEVAHSLTECSPMLFGQHRSRDENGDLRASRDRLEGRSDGNLGFAEADVAADEAIHRLSGLHVRFGFRDGLSLVGCFSKWKGVLEFPHPPTVCGVCISLFRVPLGVCSEKSSGIVHDRCFCGFADFSPPAIA